MTNHAGHRRPGKLLPSPFMLSWLRLPDSFRTDGLLYYKLPWACGHVFNHVTGDIFSASGIIPIPYRRDNQSNARPRSLWCAHRCASQCLWDRDIMSAAQYRPKFTAAPNESAGSALWPNRSCRADNFIARAEAAGPTVAA